MRDRVVAYVTRERDGQKELLVFDEPAHPAWVSAGTQVPAGRVDPGESLEETLLRELDEEAGLVGVSIVRKIGTYQPGTLPHGVDYLNHAYEVAAPDAPDAWEHVVHGDGDDAGLTFVYRWVPLDPAPTLWSASDPVLDEL